MLTPSIPGPPSRSSPFYSQYRGCDADSVCSQSCVYAFYSQLLGPRASPLLSNHYTQATEQPHCALLTILGSQSCVSAVFTRCLGRRAASLVCTDCSRAAEQRLCSLITILGLRSCATAMQSHSEAGGGGDRVDTLDQRSCGAGQRSAHGPDDGRRRLGVVT